MKKLFSAIFFILWVFFSIVFWSLGGGFAFWVAETVLTLVVIAFWALTVFTEDTDLPPGSAASTLTTTTITAAVLTIL